MRWSMVPWPSSSQHTDITARVASSASLVPFSLGLSLDSGQELGHRRPHWCLARIPALVEEPPDQQRELRRDVCRHIRPDPVPQSVQHRTQRLIGVMQLIKVCSFGDLPKPHIGLRHRAIDHAQTVLHTGTLHRLRAPR